MIKNKNRLIIALTASLAVVGSAGYITGEFVSAKSLNNSINEPKVISVHSNFLDFENVNKLDNFADLIVIGAAKQNFEDRTHVETRYEDGSLQDFYTVTDIEIKKVLKAPLDFSTDTKTVQMIEPLSYININNENTLLTREEYIEIQKNDDSVIFLKKNSQGQYSIINENLGKFSLDDPLEVGARGLTSLEVSEYDNFREKVFEKYKINN